MSNVYINNGRNGLVLMSFVNYCNTHPDMRFWQALSSWAGFTVLACKVSWLDKILDFNPDIEDTFHWEGKDR